MRFEMLIKFLEPNFIFVDERGLLIQLVRDGFKQVNYITAKKNNIRGGHFHKFNREAFFVISGKFDLDLSDLENEVQEKHTISAGEFFEIQPNVLHSFKFLEETQLISMYSSGVELKDGSKDIFVN